MGMRFKANNGLRASRLVHGYCSRCDAFVRGQWSLGRKWQCLVCGWLRPKGWLNGR